MAKGSLNNKTHFGASRRPSGEARKGAHTRCMQAFAQRRRAGWIGVPKWVLLLREPYADHLLMDDMMARGWASPAA